MRPSLRLFLEVESPERHPFQAERWGEVLHPFASLPVSLVEFMAPTGIGIEGTACRTGGGRQDIIGPAALPPGRRPRWSFLAGTRVSFLPFRSQWSSFGKGARLGAPSGGRYSKSGCRPAQTPLRAGWTSSSLALLQAPGDPGSIRPLVLEVNATRGSTFNAFTAARAAMLIHDWTVHFSIRRKDAKSVKKDRNGPFEIFTPFR